MPASSTRVAVKSPKPGGKVAVVRGLITGLLSGDFKGGARITEADAVTRFGVSRTPVREALLELQGLGFVELRRNCGAIFLPFGPEELQEIYAVRSLLEAEATRLAAGRLEPAIIEKLLAAFTYLRETREADPDWENDRTLHRVIGEASGNRRLLAEISRYGEVVQTVRDIVGKQSFRIHETTADEHLDILAALAREDGEAAAAAMQTHLAQAAASAADAVGRMRRGLRKNPS